MGRSVVPVHHLPLTHLPASLLCLHQYPYTTVPGKVDQLFRAQEFHARKQHQALSGRLLTNPTSSGDSSGGSGIGDGSVSSDSEWVDYLRPIVADGDTGHGGVTAVMKLTKLLIEAGAAGIHLEDQKPGQQNTTHSSRPTNQLTHWQRTAPHLTSHPLSPSPLLLRVTLCASVMC